MSQVDRIADLVTTYSVPVIVVVLILSGIVGYGAGMVEQESQLSQFESDTPEVEAANYISANLSGGDENVTTVQVIVRNESGNALSKASLLRTLRYQQALRDNATVNATLVDENPVVGVANVVATNLIVREQRREFQARRAALEQRGEELNATAEQLVRSLFTVWNLQDGYTKLNLSYEFGRISEAEYENKSALIESRLDSTITNATVLLDPTDTREFQDAVGRMRAVQRDYTVLNLSYEQGRIGDEEYERRSENLSAERATIFREGTEGVLAEDFRALREDGEQLREDVAAFRESPPNPTLSEQIAALESTNGTELRGLLERLLRPDSELPGGEQALRLLPSGYETGTANASATMLFVRQSQAGETVAPQGYSETVVEAQLAMQAIGVDTAGDGAGGTDEYITFGFGIISEEISQSQTDSFRIVGPLALLFVLGTLLVAYRDLMDIVLGLVGIFLVLLWTWGYMGWRGISFNQIMIAVPVLLIGLSIDYAIHIFMRHREARLDENGEGGPRGSMRVALAGVGVALVWVTATTVIGFLSNLISPLPPIRNFGEASSAGIVAALIIFGAFIPAVKVEMDGLLERFGFDRRKRAFGTGDGRLASVLSVGSIAARKAPAAVVLVVLVATVAGAAGATQVGTQFEQEDFLAEDPPGWMDHLPEQIRPGEYSAKENLQYVYANFQSPDKQAQLLIRDGDGASVTDPVALERLAATHDTLDDRAGGAVIYSDPAGNARILSPLSVMREVAATNESFNRTFSRADTDGDRVPDRNVTGVYDHLFEVAPGQAERVIYRTAEGSYDALRLQVFVQGTATTTEITEAMREVGDTYGGDDFQVVATGDPIVNEVIQNQLLDTVIQSLIVTLLAVIGFLMVVYRVTEGSALLGVVTLLPVALSVAWILGTMYLLSIPFNAVTGTITSLTIGLGVAYCIHMSERFGIELERRDNAWVAMRTSVTGTGGALLGSAATTAGGFGVLAFSILPPLEQFGIITAISIIYAFLGSVLVLPTLLTFWTKTVGPDADWSDPDARRPEESSTGGSDPDRQEPVAQGEAPVAEADDPATAAELSPTTGDGDPEPADAASPTESTDDGGPGDRHGSAPTGGSFEQGSDGIFPPQTEGETEVVDEDPGDSADLDPDEREDAVEGARTPDVEPEPRTDLDPSAGVANGTRPPGESPEGSARGRSDGGGGSEAPPGEFDSDADGESRGQPSTDGSEWASFGRPDGSDDPDPSATPESETHDSEGATGQAPESAASPDDRAGTPTDGTSSLAPAHGDHSPDRPALERSIAPREVRPGDLVTVSLLARGHRGRLVLTERVPGVAGRIESYDPEPLTRAKDGRTVYFAWDLPSPTDVGLTYTTRVPEGATAGERLAFEGTVETADGSREVEGDDTVLVVSDVVAELLDRETTTAETVATAGKYLRDGVIGAAGFERIYRRWLADQPAAERSPVRERGED